MAESYDLIVIGGGIIGAAAAREAALRGKRVLLLEKGYFSQGTSSKTSKLAHGGLRYLSQWAFHLVKESIQERDRLLQTARKRVRPMPFILPVYDRGPYPLWQVRLGLFFYRLFSRKKAMPLPVTLSKNEALAFCPDLLSDGLKGAGLYYDAQMDDVGLTYDVLQSARWYGAICLPHHEVTSLECQDEHWVVKAQHQDQEVPYRAQSVLVATGPWTNQIVASLLGQSKSIVRPSKGSHVVLRGQRGTTALTLTTPQDGRVFFIIPYRGHSLVGTTETDYSEDPGEVRISAEETAYLLDAINYYFPDHPFSKSDVLWSFSGCRPLAQSLKAHATNASRELTISSLAPNCWTVAGGKYTTFRAIGETVIDRLFGRSTRQEARSCSEMPALATPLKDFIYQRWGQLVVAHRGNTQLTNCIENTVEAFENALTLGATMIECDLQLSQSGSIIIFHDTDGERLLEDPTPVVQLTDEQLAIAKFKDDSDAIIPTLSDFLAAAGGRTYLYLEIKNADRQDDTVYEPSLPVILEKTVTQLEQLKLLHTAMIATFSPELIIESADRYPDLLFGWNLATKDCFDRYKDQIKPLTRVICPDKHLFSPAELTALIEEGWFVMPYTFKSADDFERLKDVELAGYTCDDLLSYFSHLA